MEKNYIHKIDDVIMLDDWSDIPMSHDTRVQLHRLAWEAQSEIWTLTKKNKDLQELLIAAKKEISALKRNKA